MCSLGLGPLPEGVRAKVMHKNLFTGGRDHFPKVRVQKLTHKNVFAGGWDTSTTHVALAR